MRAIDQFSLLPAEIVARRRRDRVALRWSLAISVTFGVLVASFAAAYQRQQEMRQTERSIAAAAGPILRSKQQAIRVMNQTEQLSGHLNALNQHRPNDELLQTVAAIADGYASHEVVGGVEVSVDLEQATFRAHLISPADLVPELTRSIEAIDRVVSVESRDAGNGIDVGVDRNPVPSVGDFAPQVPVIFEGRIDAAGAMAAFHAGQAMTPFDAGEAMTP